MKIVVQIPTGPLFYGAGPRRNPRMFHKPTMAGPDLLVFQPRPECCNALRAIPLAPTERFCSLETLV